MNSALWHIKWWRLAVVCAATVVGGVGVDPLVRSAFLMHERQKLYEFAATGTIVDFSPHEEGYTLRVLTIANRRSALTEIRSTAFVADAEDFLRLGAAFHKSSSSQSCLVNSVAHQLIR